MRYYAIAAVAAVALVGVPAAASAQEDAATACADAVVALNKAQTAFDDAVKADQAVADAEAAKKSHEQAQEARDKAQQLVAPITTQDAAEERRDLVKKALDTGETSTGAELTGDDRVRLEGEMGRLDDYIAAEKALTEAAERDKDNVSELRIEADKTDADALRADLDYAREVFNRDCAEGSQGATPEPSDDQDGEVIRNYELNPKDTSQVGKVPVGGVQTGIA